MIYLIGGNGFVGSAYARLFTKLGLAYRVITRDNAADFYGTSCDVLINANGNSKKYLADKQPLDDFDASVRSVAKTIEVFNPEYYVHLSTGDVYSETTLDKSDERRVLDPSSMSRYGLHKYMSEMLVQGTQKRWLIVRMGGFVGPGLKKNAIFDLMSGDPIWLTPSSRLQFINTDNAADIIWTVITRRPDNQIINLGGQGTVLLSDVHALVSSKSQFRVDAKQVTYELSTDRITKLYGMSLPSTADEVMTFVNQASSQKMA